MATLPIQNQTVDAIYRSYEAKAEKPRTYLGMSQMGTECDRALWYSFRWCGAEKFDGRMLRLFQTGHREEARMLDDLEAAGIKVYRRDLATGQQFAVSAIDGHFRGHMDGMGERFPEAYATMHLLEFKTHSEKSYKDVVSKGVQLSKPGHYAQVQLYMHFTGLTRAFYLAHNKNSDELYQERIAYDAVEASRLVARAERIIKSDIPPPRLHENPSSKAAWACQFCPHFAVCHERALPPRNCRTCLSASPVAGGFSCDLFHQVNDPHMQRLGCSRHLYIPQLVSLEQVDADPAARTVTYKFANGQVFVDGGKNG